MKKITLWALSAMTMLAGCSASEVSSLVEEAQASDLISGAVYKISPYSDEIRSMSVRNASFDEGTEIVAWTDTKVNAQRWRLTKDPAGVYFYLTNVHTGKSVHIQSPVSLGARLRQYGKENDYTYKWTITKAGEAGADCYYISPSSLASGERLYLETVDNGDGTNIQSYIKRTGDQADRQIWKLERVQEVPDKFTSVMRDEIVRAWKTQYYKKSQNSAGYTLSDAERLNNASHQWQDSEMFEIVLDAYETTQDPSYKEMFHQLYINFVDENQKNWLYNPFNDDITWTVIACVRAYLLFGTQEYLDVARENFDQMYARALMLPEGVLRWCEKEAERDKTNSCINCPAMVASCYLAQATGDETYYEKAKSLYEKQSVYLYESSTGMVYDCVTLTSLSPWKWASTYNQGTFLGASLMLYQHYKDELYKTNAQKIARYTVEHFSDDNGILNAPDERSDNDRRGFKGILMRYLRSYINVMDDTQYLPWMEASALQAYNNRNSKGIIWTVWEEKSAENFVYKASDKDVRYSNDPWGTSTAVSIAVNLPLIQK